MKAENEKLRDLAIEMVGRQRVESVVRTTKRDSIESFLEALKNPSNRIVDKSTKSFLGSLRSLEKVSSQMSEEE